MCGNHAVAGGPGWRGPRGGPPILTFKRTELYLACNPAIPDALVAKMNAVLRAMNSEGVSAPIERKYNFSGKN